MNHYKSFIEFKTKHFETVDKNGLGDCMIFDLNDTDDKLLGLWIEQTNKGKVTFEIDDCLLKDFPLHEQAKLISEFVPNSYKYAWGPDYQITKLIYILWNKYMLDKDGDTIKYKDRNKSNEYHTLIFESLYTLKTKLKEMKNITPDDIFELRRTGKSDSGYYNWHLFGCIPLLGDKGLPILRNITTLYYDDAQEFIMFALYQYEPKSFYNNLKEILLYWCEHENISFSTGTSMLYQFYLIVNKYKQNGIDIVNDPDLAIIFNKHINAPEGTYYADILKVFSVYEKN